MAVYTTLTEYEVRSLLKDFNLPMLASMQASNSGIENTTYFLTLDTGAQYVLSVFENFSSDMLQPYIQLMAQLGCLHLPVANPCINSAGNALQLVAHKPALLFARSPGEHIELTDPPICHQIGNALAEIHCATANPPLNLPMLANPHSLSWMHETLAFINDSLEPADIKILQNQINLYADLQTRHLPQGIIHGDLFRDNALVQTGTITAVIDFYNAGQDILLMDLAITANDWCYAQTSGEEGQRKVESLLQGYQLHKPLSKSEISSWQDCLQVAAARLWLSRQKRIVLSQRGGRGAVKDPQEYKLLLLQHIKSPKRPA